MAKECPNCKDKVEYPSNLGECPKCGNFLKVKRSSKPDVVDDFADVFDNILEDPIMDERPNHSNENRRREDLKSNQQGNISFDNFQQEKTTNRKNKPTKVKKETKQKLEVIKGEVDNFNEEVIQEHFITKWFDSIFKGIPFSRREGVINTFHVYDEVGEGHEVILYGKILRGKIGNHNLVKVTGKRDQHGAVVARYVENLNSKTTVSVKGTTSANSVRLFTLLCFIVVLYLVFGVNWVGLINSIVTGTMNLFFWLLNALLPLIIVIGVLWFGFRKIRRRL